MFPRDMLGTGEVKLITMQWVFEEGLLSTKLLTDIVMCPVICCWVSVTS